MEKIEVKSIGILLDELITTDIKCFMEQDKMMAAKEGEDISASAIKTQQLNARRNELIRAIDSRLGEAQISPTDKTYKKE
jgi:hypothetical protein